MPKRKPGSPVSPGKRKERKPGSPCSPSTSRRKGRTTRTSSQSSDGETELKSQRQASQGDDNLSGKPGGDNIVEDFSKLKNYSEKETRLENRFARMTIDVVQWKSLPVCFWLVKSNPEAENTKEYYTIKSSPPKSSTLQKYITKWRNEEKRALVAFQDKFKKVWSSLCYDAKKDTCSIQEVLGTSKQHSSEKNENSSKKDASADLSPSERKMMVNLTDNFVSAFTHKMHNSKGRRFIQSLLEVVSYVCFGEEYYEDIKINPVGTSNSRAEGFPVNVCDPIHESANVTDVTKESDPGSIGVLSPITGKQKVDNWQVSPIPNAGSTPMITCKRKSRSSPGACLNQSKASSVVSRDPSPHTCPSVATSQRTSKACSKYLYADCLVTSMYKDFARYLMVAEVKSSGRLSNAELGQLHREMLGAGMHQSEVFGLLISYGEAQICRMILDKQNKTVRMFTHDIYHFCTGSSSQPCMLSFDSESFCRFFQDLAAVLDYANAHISEVEYE